MNYEFIHAQPNLPFQFGWGNFYMGLIRKTRGYDLVIFQSIAKILVPLPRARRTQDIYVWFTAEEHKRLLHYMSWKMVQ